MTLKRRNQQSEQEQDSNNDQSDQQQKVQIKKPKVERLDQMKNLKKIVINVSMTQYPVVTDVAEELGWKVQTSPDAGDWDIFWTDFHVEADVIIKMHLFQKINHYPGIQNLARKNLLGLNLMGMRQIFPEQFDFFPLTWMLPQQYVEFRTYFQSKQKGKARTYIVKPQADCQGRGIFLTRKMDSIQNGKHYVVQRYLARPFLIDNLKFDMRIYVLLGSVNPLRIYLYQQGLARFATEAYIEPTNSNLQKQYMHLTNYAINKRNPKFIFNTNSANMNIGHKRSLTAVYKQLQSKGVNIAELKQKISDLFVKTIITGLPIMSHQYKCSQPQDFTGNMCFHVLGFDVMLKNNGQPLLLEVNHTPSFTTDTPLDFKIKKNLIKDTLKLMNVNIKKKTQLYNRSMENNQTRLLTGKRNILEGVEREELLEKCQKEREQYEKNNLGGFQVIYPIQDQQKMDTYKKIMDHANKQYFQEKGSIRMKIAQKQAKKMARQQYKQLKKMQNQQNIRKTNDSITIAKSAVIISQTNKFRKKSSTPATQHIIMRQQTKKTIDSKISSSNAIYETISDTKKTQAMYKPTSRTDKLHSQSNPYKIPVQPYQQNLKQRKMQLLSKLSQKTTQLPNILDNEVFHPSNLIRRSQYDHRRYNKASIQKNVVQRSVTGKTEIQQPNMIKSMVNQQRTEAKHRTNFSGLMARKKVQAKHITSKVSKDLGTDAKESSKVIHIGYQNNYNPNIDDFSNNGEYVMPKIFCLNFQAEKNNNDQLKFLMYKNLQNPTK